MLCNHHHHPTPEHSDLVKPKASPLNPLSPPCCSRPLVPTALLSSSTVLSALSPVSRILQRLSFVAGLFPFAYACKQSFPGVRARPGPGEHCGSGALAAREYLEAQGGWRVWSAEQNRLGTGRCVRPPFTHCLPLHGVCLPLGGPAPANLSPGGAVLWGRSSPAEGQAHGPR